MLMRAVSRQFDAMFLIRWDATESQSKYFGIIQEGVGGGLILPSNCGLSA